MQKICIMTGHWRKEILFSFVVLVNIYSSHGCWIEGVDNWSLPQSTTILDTFTGNVFDRNTANIDGIVSYYFSNGFNLGPYVNVTLHESRFVIATNNAFKDYEEYETKESITVTVTFRCPEETRALVFLIEIEDTNHNPPQFQPSNDVIYTILTPSPPGTLITGCSNGIRVKDIDLTTERIDFEIEENPYFEILYDANCLTSDKEFIGILKSTTFLRSMPEPITLKITATDVNRSNVSSLTATATVTIKADPRFEFPEEPVFTQAFYLANYTDDNQLVLSEPISLRKGFDELVQFNLEGGLSDSFAVETNGNQVLLRVVTPLAASVLREKQIFIVVRANREYTSGDSTTIVVRLPEEAPFEFEKPHYEGTLESNILRIPQLVLAQGYEKKSVYVEVIGEYAEYFTPSIEGNIVALKLKALPDNIMYQNNVMLLEISASNQLSIAKTIVILKIKNGNNLMPISNMPNSWSSNTATGLTREQIISDQGHDESIQRSSQGGCSMEGVDNWGLPQGTVILDTFRGNVFDRATNNIDSISSFSFFDGLNAGPYVNVALADSRFVISTNDAFKDYEEYETEESMTVTVNFRCSGGGTGILVFLIEVEDTNNNPPQFLPSNDFVYTILTPLAPGITITGCFDGIRVRDIDLTTERIDFEIEENPYFEIVYDALSSTTDKEFIGILRSTTFVRNIPEPIILTITATDVDRTSDPPLTATATVTIKADAEFEFPEELVFTQAYYLANYTDDNQLVLSEPISLRNGFDEFVQFNLEGELSDSFALEENGNQILIRVVTPIAANVLRENQVLLVVRADREFTSGDSATIVIRLPEAVPLEFERAHYEGTIESNYLRVPQLVLAQGYEGNSVYVEVISEQASYFTPNIQGNMVTLTLQALPDNVINQNSVISLEIVASTGFSSARTIVTLEIIKDDNVTPVFNRPIYTGSYNTETGLTLEQIVFDQGYDETVELSLEGEHAALFTTSQQGLTVILDTTGIPTTIFSEQRILLTLQATKPRTVGANAAIVISLPAARQLGFEESTYKGTLQDNVLSIEPITLSTGYDEDIEFFARGDYESYFLLTPVQNRVTITLRTPIPENVMQESNIIILTIEASGLNAITTTTTVLVDIIKEDITTPVFSRNIYYGIYQSTSDVNIENINLVQGFGSDVTVGLQGEHAQYFQILNTDNGIEVSLQSQIPDEIIFREKVLIFNVVANKPLTVGANAAIYIGFPSELTEPVAMSFAQNTYTATLDNHNLRADEIILSAGYERGTQFFLSGEYSAFFTITDIENTLLLSLVNPLPIDNILDPFIVLEVEARRERAVTTSTSIVIDIIRRNTEPLIFTQAYYQGFYVEETEELTTETISLALGYDDTVIFQLEGDLAPLFSIEETFSNSFTITAVTSIPSDILTNNSHLLLSVTATKENAITARAAVSINIERVTSLARNLQFSKDFYTGFIEGSSLTLDTIILEGYSNDVVHNFTGDYADYFQLTSQNGLFTLQLLSEFPAEVIQSNKVLVFTLEAQIESTRTHTTIILELIKHDAKDIEFAFEEVYYVGSYSETYGLLFNAQMRLIELPNSPITYSLTGAQSEWFELEQSENTLTLALLRPIPAETLENNYQLIFAVQAETPGLDAATATLVITIIKENLISTTLGFDQVSYIGSIQNSVVTLQPITLIEGYTQDVTFSLNGGLASYFTFSSLGAGAVGVTLTTAIPDESIPANNIIVLEIRASAPEAIPTFATIVFEVIVEDDASSASQLMFNATYYTGSYTAADGLTLNSAIILAEGYDQTVKFALEGEHSQWFEITQSGNYVTLSVSSSIPSAVLATNRKLIFIITAQRSGSNTVRSTIVISLIDDSQTGEDVLFSKLIYEGFIQLSSIQHELILISNYNEGNVQLYGEYSSLFEAFVVDGVVTVQAPGSLTLPDDVTQVNLELHAANARAVLLLSVIQSDTPVLPSVTFSSASYELSVDIVQTGLVGRVLASADNGESLTYSLAIEDAHLQARLSINNAGELYLSAPANSGVYTFQVIATTVITRTEGTATVYLSVEDITICGDDVVVSPLIILNRDEEEPHNNLVPLNTEGCWFTLTNRWPINQDWLYVDANGLHTRSIDREHESIAFMALSQVQVELILQCESDSVVRTKRSQRTDWLGPYDYGSNDWIITETIPYNARRSLVNLIVNDINDNAPIFVGKELEPIAVGYPISELEERILPRSLAELQATDADIGENAILKYWSSEDVLAVAPTTGFVHVRSGARLENNQILTISATDRNGEGLTGEIQVLVKLLDISNIVVITVKDAFLDDEKTVLKQLSEALGYEVKVLRSVVISDSLEPDVDDVLRKKRETGTAGASLLLYAYGLIQREPVTAERLIADINNNAAVASIINTVSLEDHLDPVEIIISERDIGLLVATIVLGILLFIIIVIIAIWSFLKWRQNYDKFSDENSLVSRNGSNDPLPNPRFNIEELRRSEKRLQNMLNAPTTPVKQVTIEPITPKREDPVESVIDLSPPEVSAPIVIQSIDKLKDADETDDDEFGEKNGTRRKSVVTFNENVEKIIHVEDDLDSVSSQSEYEVYRL